MRKGPVNRLFLDPTMLYSDSLVKGLLKAFLRPLAIGNRVTEGYPRLCERCNRRPSELLIIGEAEGKAVYVCGKCRERSFLKRFGKAK